MKCACSSDADLRFAIRCYPQFAGFRYALRRGWECPGCVRLTQPAEAVASDPGLPSAAVATKTTPKKKAASMKSRSTEETGFNLLNVYGNFDMIPTISQAFPIPMPPLTRRMLGSTP